MLSPIAANTAAGASPSLASTRRRQLRQLSPKRPSCDCERASRNSPRGSGASPSSRVSSSATSCASSAVSAPSAGGGGTIALSA
jgi:hypothetical protein